MSSFQIIVGSMLGGTEYVAEACEETLQALGHQTNLHLQPDLGQISSNNQTWLICTSTHGAGDFPDNIQKFISDLRSNDQDLSSVKTLVLGIGDRSYDTFCLAAIETETLLKSKGCNQISATKTLDMSQDIDPEELAKQWISDLQDLL
ncbi:MAG: flavodoxin domain-containing protein [Colwellia sp.]|nr:flavodoxin domain-containing protein [Colwellia sp.]